MSTQADQTTQLHGGRLVARRLKHHGVSKLFTLSGGHLFPIFAGCRAEGIDIVDVRPRIGGGLRRRRLGQGDPRARRM